MEMEATTLVDSIVKNISIALGTTLTVYDGKITQNLDLPCIMVTEYRVNSKDNLYNFKMEDQTIECEIHCKEKTMTGSEDDTEIYSYTRRIANELKKILPLITLYKYNSDRSAMIATTHKVRGTNFNWHVDNGNGYVYITYKYRTLEETSAEPLETLTANQKIK